MSWKKWVLTIAVVSVVLPLGLFTYSVFDSWADYYCWQCGARRDVYRFHDELKESRWAGDATHILGHPCRHEHWEQDASAGGGLFGYQADRFAYQYMPLHPSPSGFQPGAQGLFKAINFLPLPAWRRQSLIAVGDPVNRGKWVAVAVLMSLGDYWDELKPPEDWNLWWLENEKYFVVVTVPARANELAVEFSRSNNQPGESGFVFEEEMRRDLRRLGEE